MNYFNIIDKLKTHFTNDVLVNTVTQGNLYDIDLAKQTIFPLVHIICNSATLESNVVRYNISILAMDIVDISKEESENKFDGNDNELYILNTQLQVLTRCYELLLRGDLYTDAFQVDGNPTCEPFVDRFENKLDNYNGYINRQRNDYLLMSEFKNIQELLDDFKDKVITQAKSNLKSTGALKSSLRGYVKESKNSIQISFEMEDYGAFVD